MAVVESGAGNAEGLESLAAIDLDSLVADAQTVLQEARTAAQLAAMSEAEVRLMVKKMRETEKRMETAKQIRDQRLARIEAYDPLKDVTPLDVDKLVAEGFIFGKQGEKIKQLQNALLNLYKAKTLTAEGQAHLVRCQDALEQINKEIKTKLDARRSELNERRAQVKETAVAHYAARIQELEGIVKSIRENPRVIEHLRQLEEKARTDAEKRMIETYNKTYEIVRRDLKSLVDRHRNAFNRLIQVLGDPEVKARLEQAFVLPDEKKKTQAFGEIRAQLREAILHGKDQKQVKSPSELVPWDSKSPIDYFEAVDHLRSDAVVKALEHKAAKGDELAKKLIDDRAAVLNENNVLRYLFGKRWERDNRGNRVPGPFWNLFEIREKIISAEAEKAARELKKQEAAAEAVRKFNEDAKDIIARGGLVVEVPVYEKYATATATGSRLVGKRKGAVELEKSKNKNGLTMWKVKALAGERGGLEVGRAFSSVNQMPPWLKAAYEKQQRGE